MSTQMISQRYARALMNLAGKDVDAVAHGLDEAAALLGSAEVTAFLGNGSVGWEDKTQALKALLAKQGGPEVLSPFIRLVHQKRRLELLPEIATVFRRLADEKLGRAQADVKVAEPLTGDLQERLRKQIEKATGKTIALNVKVDPSILGGAVTRVGSVVWDGSVRHHLERVREQLLRG